MRILFDQGTPVPLRDSLTGHTVATAYEMNWSTLENGDLLTEAEKAGFELFVTTDQNLRYQQDLQNRQIGHRSAHHAVASDRLAHCRSCCCRKFDSGG